MYNSERPFNLNAPREVAKWKTVRSWLCFSHAQKKPYPESEECVNDVFLKAWESIPPKKPSNLSGYLAKLTRNHAINWVKCRNAVKRGSGQITLALEELEECIPDKCDVERQMEQSALTGLLNEFLASLPVDTRRIFMRRYWYLSPVKEIASDFGISESKVKMQLLRARKKLKTKLEREGFE